MVLWPRSVSWPVCFLVSTGLYPEWPLAAAPHVKIDIANQVAAALLLMPPDSPAARAARYYRWSTPLEYHASRTSCAGTASTPTTSRNRSP